MLAQINIPEAPDQDLQGIAYAPNLHNHFRNAQWERGDPWNAWVNTMRQLLLARIQHRQEIPTTTTRTTSQ